MPNLEKIKFEKSSQEAKLRSPLDDFRPVSQTIEVRKDPLTGKTCRINVNRAIRPKSASVKSVELDKLIKESRVKCSFCPENIEKSTPMFADGLPDRIRVNKSWLFPNLFPFGGFHAVGVLSEAHYLEIYEFTPELIEDCLTACLKYIELVHSKHADIRYGHINWNYMPPGAASLIHPHMQTFADSEPTPYLQELTESSRIYHKANGGNFWSELLKAEKNRGERFIGGTSSVNWLASFAPQGNREVIAIFNGVSSIADLDKQGLAEFCAGLSRVLKGYHELGVRSLNMATLSGPCDEDLSEFYFLNVRLVSRPNPTPFYASDNGFMEKIHREPIIETMPESLAEKLREYF